MRKKEKISSVLFIGGIVILILGAASIVIDYKVIGYIIVGFGILSSFLGIYVEKREFK